ncbi:MAG: PA14 domain-containing protein [Candidatus Bathyarchaeia archaeon]
MKRYKLRCSSVVTVYTVATLVLFSGFISAGASTRAEGNTSEWHVSWWNFTGWKQWGAEIGESTFPAIFDYNWKDGPVFSGYSDQIGFKATMEIYVNKADPIFFEIGSDDSSKLFIDGEVVIDNWEGGIYRTKSTTVNLATGKHFLDLWYFEGPGWARVSFKCDTDILVGYKAESFILPWVLLLVAGVGIGGIATVTVAVFLSRRKKPSVPISSPPVHPPKEPQFFPVVSQTCPSCGVEIKSEMDYCHRCGKKLRVPTYLGADKTSEIPKVVRPKEVQIEKTGELPSINLIKAVIHGSAMKGAATSLLFWGIINLGAWILLGGEDRNFLLTLRNPGFEIYLLVYSGAIIGSLMLMFSLVGFLAKHPSVVLLDGLSLLGVGVWNITSDFLALIVLKPYGYTIEFGSFSSLWIFLGLLQTIWGSRQIRRFSKLESRQGEIDETQRKQAKQALERFVKKDPAPEAGRIKLSIRSTGAFSSGEKHYSAQLLPEQAVCVEKGLGDFFVIDKKTAPQWEWKVDRTVELFDDAGKKRKVSFKEPSLKAFMDWTSLFSEINGEPVILWSLCSLKHTVVYHVHFLFLTKSNLIIRTPHKPKQAIKVPLASITNFEIIKKFGRARTLSINTHQKQYRFINIENMEEWIAKLNQLINSK